MTVTAISLRTGLPIAPSLANFDTYLDELPRCQSCVGEVYLARGERIAPHWRHFPGVGIDCPDKSNENNNPKAIITNINRKQILAEFKKRFLQILDIGVHGDDVAKGSFVNKTFSEIAEKLSVNCNDRKVYFHDSILDIIQLIKRSWVVIECLSEVKINQVFSRNESSRWNVDEQEYIQMLETIEYKEIQIKCAREACRYIFSPGREDILKELAARAFLQYRELNFDVPPNLFSTWLIDVIVSLVSIIPWHKIMTDLMNGKKPSYQPITIFNAHNITGLAEIKSILIEANKKHKPKGFTVKNKR